jgi:hypothetical protein
MASTYEIVKRVVTVQSTAASKISSESNETNSRPENINDKCWGKS